MSERALKQSLLQVAQRRQHGLHALPELDEAVRDHLFGETSLQKPRPKMLHIPTVEPNFSDVISVE